MKQRNKIKIVSELHRRKSETVSRITTQLQQTYLKTQKSFNNALGKTTETYISLNDEDTNNCHLKTISKLDLMSIGNASQNQQLFDASQFLRQQHKQKEFKQQLYSKLREKFVQKYPSMQKYYTQYDISSPLRTPKKNINQLTRTLYAQSQNKNTMHQRFSYTPAASFHQSIQKSINNEDDFTSQKRYSVPLKERSLPTKKRLKPKGISVIFDEQLKRQTQLIEKKREKNQAIEILKQSKFYSKSKNRCMNNSISTYQPQMIKQRQKQCPINYLKYIKARRDGIKIQQKGEMKVKNILKNQESILKIEKQGSKGQQILKMCLEDIIQKSYEKK